MRRAAALILVGAALAACDLMPQQAASVPPERQAAFVALVEQSGCQVDVVDHEYLHAAGFTDAEIGEIGGQLAADGLAEFSADGDLILLSGGCI